MFITSYSSSILYSWKISSSWFGNLRNSWRRFGLKKISFDFDWKKNLKKRKPHSFNDSFERCPIINKTKRDISKKNCFLIYVLVRNIFGHRIRTWNKEFFCSNEITFSIVYVFSQIALELFLVSKLLSPQPEQVLTKQVTLNWFQYKVQVIQKSS